MFSYIPTIGANPLLYLPKSTSVSIFLNLYFSTHLNPLSNLFNHFQSLIQSITTPIFLNPFVPIKIYPSSNYFIDFLSVAKYYRTSILFNPFLSKFIIFTFSSWMRRYWFYVKNDFRNFHQIFTV